MTAPTPIDLAHRAMEAAPGDDAARLRFYERVADNELFLMLVREPEAEDIEPEIFDVADGRFVLAFDRIERLADFAGRPVPYVAIPGRALAGLLSGQGIGLGLNLEVAPSSLLIPAEAMSWLTETLTDTHGGLVADEAQIEGLHPPAGLPEALVVGLDAKLASAAGHAPMAFLAGVEYAGGGKGHLLAFIDAAPAAEAALQRAVAEALVFSGIEAGALDVGFFTASAPIAARLARVGLRFDLPQPETETLQRAAPGSDPDKPPRLR
ncbi:SseB family protein [Chachezhania sediminis]|uniref:SseB family protein n=1 Tax=Chachezhania sediminis TaxID=2599291 RepID=UPI00131B80AD|nr:SseB family protein [Chachezhania sediminis]